MNLLTLPQIWELFAVHAALRRLGVDSAHIFFAVSPERQAYVGVKDHAAAPCRLSLCAGPVPDDFEAVWPEACRAWNEGADEITAQQVWNESSVKKNAAGLVVALSLAGYSVSRDPSQLN